MAIEFRSRVAHCRDKKGTSTTKKGTKRLPAKRNKHPLRSLHLLIRIPLPTIYYLVQRGKIPAIQIGGRWRIKKSSLDHDILHQEKQGQPTALVVDDDLGLQDLFQTFSKKIGFSRVVVGTAKKAIKSLRKQKFDLMFLDPGDYVTHAG